MNTSRVCPKCQPRPRFLGRVPRRSPGRREKKETDRVGYTFLKAERIIHIYIYISNRGRIFRCGIEIRTKESRVTFAEAGWANRQSSITSVFALQLSRYLRLILYTREPSRESDVVGKELERAISIHVIRVASTLRCHFSLEYFTFTHWVFRNWRCNRAGRGIKAKRRQSLFISIEFENLSSSSRKLSFDPANANVTVNFLFHYSILTIMQFWSSWIKWKMNDEWEWTWISNEWTQR